jgi:hypothetical protein
MTDEETLKELEWLGNTFYEPMQIFFRGLGTIVCAGVIGTGIFLNYTEPQHQGSLEIIETQMSYETQDLYDPNTGEPISKQDSNTIDYLVE